MRSMDRPVDFTSVLGLVYKGVGVALGYGM